MEMNVSVNFKFEDKDKQQSVTDAFDLLNLESRNKYTHIDDKVDEFKKRLGEAIGADLSLDIVNKYTDYFTSLDSLKVNKAGSTSLNYITGSSGEEFANDIEVFLKKAGAKSVKAKVKYDYEE